MNESGEGNRDLAQMAREMKQHFGGDTSSLESKSTNNSSESREEDINQIFHDYSNYVLATNEAALKAQGKDKKELSDALKYIKSQLESMKEQLNSSRESRPAIVQAMKDELSKAGLHYGADSSESVQTGEKEQGEDQQAENANVVDKESEKEDKPTDKERSADDILQEIKQQEVDAKKKNAGEHGGEHDHGHSPHKKPFILVRAFAPVIRPVLGVLNLGKKGINAVLHKLHLRKTIT